MALQHPVPTSALPTVHHRRNTGVLLRRPALHSPRHFRFHGQRPDSAGSGADTSSSSENVVIKAAWYGSELLGIAALFFRPSPSPEGDTGATDEGVPESLDRAQVAEAIKDDFARSYFVTGQINRTLAFQLRHVVPVAAYSPATGYTEYYFDAESGKVCRHVEHWNVPKMALLRQIFRPSRWVWAER